jgi:TolB-like protein/cytochrome c-type biogenesis protein CcmH/NrfG
LTEPTEGEGESTWTRLRRRKVVQWAIAYMAGAWGLLQGIGFAADAFAWPSEIKQVALLLLLISLPIVLVLAWYHGDRGERVLRLLLPDRHGASMPVLPSGVPTVPSVRQATAAPTLIPEKSIAVLPFADLSERKDQEHFSDGLAEALIDLLTQVPDLRVPARTSSFFFKGKSDDIATIAEKLRVAHVLEGSIRKSDATIRVTAHLIRADNGYHLWSKTYDRDVKEIFQVQDEIAGVVVEALKAKLIPTQQATAHRTSNTEAYNAYLLGKQLYKRQNPTSLRRAVEAYRKAIALDPNYAAAYAGLANAEAFLADAMGDAAGFSRVQAAADADKAVALAPEQADGYAARGVLRRDLSWDWVGAKADLEKALALNPGDSVTLVQYSWLLVTLGRLTEAVAAAKEAIRIDPLSDFAWMTLGGALTYGRDWVAAQQALRRALDIEPESLYSLLFLCEVQLLEGKAADALATARLMEVEGFRLPHIAMAEHTLGHAKESQQALDDAISCHEQAFAYPIALAHAWRAEKDQALEWLERAYTQRDISLWVIMVDPLLASLGSDPRYKALLHKLNLPVG